MSTTAMQTSSSGKSREKSQVYQASLESVTSHVQQNTRITQGESWGTGTEVTNSRLRAGRRHAPDDDIEFNFFASH